jgi:hypothetical protein
MGTKIVHCNFDYMRGQSIYVLEKYKIEKELYQFSNLFGH